MMSVPFRILGLAAALALAACGTSDPVTRASARAVEPAPLGPAPAEEVAPRPLWRVTAIRVTVPRSLRVSEANVFYPLADIVWRGEPRGDRWQQVQAILEEGLARGAAEATEGPPVAVEIELQRFHALTEKARYTVGGVHAIRFLWTLRDARTGAVIDGPRVVDASTPASGGAKALAEEAQGITQRVVITARLAEVMRQELSRPVAPPPGAPALSQAPFDPSALAAQAGPGAPAAGG
jgi:hypothetical protein